MIADSANNQSGATQDSSRVAFHHETQHASQSSAHGASIVTQSAIPPAGFSNEEPQELVAITSLNHAPYSSKEGALDTSIPNQNFACDPRAHVSTIYASTTVPRGPAHDIGNVPMTGSTFLVRRDRIRYDQTLSLDCLLML